MESPQSENQVRSSSSHVDACDSHFQVIGKAIEQAIERTKRMRQRRRDENVLGGGERVHSGDL